MPGFPGAFGNAASGAAGGSAFGPVGAGIGAGLGFLGGKDAANAANRPQKSWTEPAPQLGGWGPLQQGMDWMAMAYDPSRWYQPYQNNPFIGQMSQKIFGPGFDTSVFSGGLGGAVPLPTGGQGGIPQQGLRSPFMKNFRSP
jgi:hypothetical protein